jgi:hypothetical protein
MNESRNASDGAEEHFFFDHVSDEAIERAAEKGTGAFTLGNCTGLESCPA